MKLTDPTFIAAVDRAQIPPLVRGQLLGALKASQVSPTEIGLGELERAGVPAALREGVLFQLRCAALPGLDFTSLPRSTAEVATALAQAGLDSAKASSEGAERHHGNLEQALAQIVDALHFNLAGTIERVASKDELDALVERLAGSAVKSELGAFIQGLQPRVAKVELGRGRGDAVFLGDDQAVLSLYGSKGSFYVQQGETTQADRYFNANMVALGRLDLATSELLVKLLDQVLADTKGKHGGHPAMAAVAEAAEAPGFLQVFRAAVVQHEAELRAEARVLAEDIRAIDAHVQPTEQGTWIVTEAFKAPVDYVAGEGPGGYERADKGRYEVGARNVFRMIIPTGAELFTYDRHPGEYFRKDGTQRGAWIRYEGKIYRVDQETRGSQSDGGGLQYRVNGLEELGGFDLAECRRFGVAFPAHWFPADNGGSIYEWRTWK